ncbi:hypothetical protein GN958_ATG12127 [Phytophthora infestans]|nr:hypothetical protein GN958_ATG12127 [Phytophthora infestans]
MSEFAAAKCKIVAEMLKSPWIPIWSVMENTGCLLSPISASKAHSKFFQNLEKYNAKVLSALYCVRRKIDRLDLTQYMLTGKVLASPNVASLVANQHGRENVVATERKTTKSAAKKKRNFREKEEQK